MSKQLIEPVRAGEFLLSEANGERSREAITVALGQNLKAGCPVGKVLLGAAAAAAAASGGNTGNGTLGTFVLTSSAKIGAYVVTCTAAATNAGTFNVVDPDGESLGNATVGVAFSKNGCGFTIADGSTDFIVGDTFTVTVTPAVASAVAGNTGNGTIGVVTVSATGVKAGVYRIIAMEPATNAGKFIVEDPDGIEIGVATVGVAFSGGGLGFTIADGSTDYASGDSFLITVTDGSGSYREALPTAKDGSAVAAGLLYKDCDASDAATTSVAIVRDAEYNESILPWNASLNGNQKTAIKNQLKALGIVARTGIGSELGR